MSASRFSAILDIQSRGTAELKKLEDALGTLLKQAEAAGKKTGDPAKKAADQAKKSVDELKSSLGNIRAAVTDPMAAAGGAVDDFLLKFGKVGLVAGGVAAGLGTAAYAMFNIANATQDLAENQTNAAAAMGLTIREYGQFSQAAQNANLSGDILVNTMRRLTQALSENESEGRRGKQALQEIGFSATDAYGNMKPMREILIGIGEGLGRVENPAKRADAAIKIFGRRGIDLLPLLNGNIRQTLARMEELGVGFDRAGAAAANEFGEKVDDAATRIAAFKLQLGLATIGLIDFFSQAGKSAALLPGLITYAGRALTQLNQARTGEVLTIPQERLQAAATPWGTMGPDAQLRTEGYLERSTKDLITRLTSQKDTQGRLAAVQKQLTEAIRENDLLGVKSALAQQSALETQIKAETAAAAKAEEAKRAAEKFLKTRQELEAVIAQQYKTLTTGSTLTGRMPALSSFGGRNNFEDLAALTQSLELEANLRSLALGQFGKGKRDAIEGRGTDDVAGLQRTLTGISEQTLSAAERRRKVLEQEVDLETQKIQLMAGPGGEVEAVNLITQLRIQALEKQKALGADIFETELAQARILEERNLRILEIRKQHEAQLRTAGESLFDAALAGGGGLRRFITSAALVPARQIAGNAAVEAFGGMAGKFQLPGLTGTGGEANILGRLLQGTPFGIDPMKAAGDLQMDAAQIQLQAASTMAGAVGIPGAAGTAASGGGLLGSLPRILGGAAGTSGIFTNQPGGIRWEDQASLGALNAASLNRPPSNLTRNLGIAGALGAGAFGAYSGFSAGGAQGALTGTASIAGAAGALLPMLSKGLALAGPIGMGAGMALGLVASLIGDPKKNRADKMASTTEGWRYTAPDPVSVSTDMRGQELYYDMRGNLQSAGGRQVTFVYQVSAVDAPGVEKFFQENYEALGKGVYRAIQQGGGEMVPAMRDAMGLS